MKSRIHNGLAARKRAKSTIHETTRQACHECAFQQKAIDPISAEFGSSPPPTGERLRIMARRRPSR
ncbi:MAG: hypothetical protein IT523_00610 [Burkholderiales bacterium]|nr:hypothetical protein [Pseudomonadota bacterium]MCC7066933.1 hypothetical protein [Burkholderiales bacterium]